MNPIRFLIALAGSSLLTIGFGAMIAMVGIRGLRGKPFPVTNTWNISGLPGRIAGGIMAFFGVLFVLVGLITIPLCLIRIWYLLQEG